jgi:hypothetical protein
MDETRLIAVYSYLYSCSLGGHLTFDSFSDDMMISINVRYSFGFIKFDALCGPDGVFDSCRSLIL